MMVSMIALVMIVAGIARPGDSRSGKGTHYIVDSTFYVALNGSDTATGTLASPFATLQHCVDVVPDGGTCILAGGRYDRDLDQFTTLINKSVTIAGDVAASLPPVLDGSTSLKLSWKLDELSQCIYTSSPLQKNIWQLWMNVPDANHNHSSSRFDGFMPLTPARFPNAKLGDDSVFDSAPSSTSGRTNGSVLYSSKTSTSGRLVEDGTHMPSMASSGIDFTGMIAVVPLGTMGSETQGVRVNKYSKGETSFSYTSPPGTAGKGHTNIPFFFEGDCRLLDSEGEWCYDLASQSIKVWLDDCADPSRVEFRGKVREYLVNTTTRKINITFRNLVFWGGTFAAPQANVVLDNVQMFFPNANKRILGQEGITSAETVLDLNSAAGSIRATNTTFEWIDHTYAFDRVGVNAYFSDCRFLRNNYALGLSASLSDGGSSSGLIFQNNFISIFNAFTGLTPGYHSTIIYNEISHQRPSVDGAGIHVHIGPQNGILIHRNWAHDMTIKAIRFDRVNSPTATWGVNGTATENIAWRTGAATFKGDKHVIANNTVFDSSDDDITAALFVMMFDKTKPWAIPGENKHTQLTSNAADSIFNVSGVLPGIPFGNVGGVPIRPMLKAPDKFDFRPQSGTQLAAKQAGAYHHPDDFVWTPGPRWIQKQW